MIKRILYTLSLVFVFNMTIFAQRVEMEIPKGRIELFDSFEHGNYWIWAGSDYDQWGVHKYSTGANLSKAWASESVHSLECVIEARSGGSGWYDGTWFYDGDQDLSGSNYIVIDIYNPYDVTFEVALTLQATDKWNWDDCGTYKIGKGKNTLVYDCKKYAAELNDVKRINLNIGTTETSSNEQMIYVDNIRLVK